MILSMLLDGALCEREVTDVTFDLTCDVLCVGAGAAGCYAADAAARDGADVTLLEYGRNIGGMPVCGGVTGYYYGTPGGAYEEDDAARMQDPLFRMKSGWEARQIHLTARLDKSGVRTLCGVSPLGVYREGDRVVGLLYCDDTGRHAVRATVTIDATSDGHLLRMLPVKLEYGRPIDGTTVPFTVRTQYLDGRGYYSDNSDSGMVDQYDCRAYSRAIIRAHANAAKHIGGESGEERFLSVALRTGVREGLRFEGEETLACQELLEGKSAERVLFYAYSDLDRHGHDRALDDEFCQDWWVIAGLATVAIRIPVPMGAVVPRGIRGLVTAGRCLSTDTYVASAVRMNRDMFRMGECVGYAAAAAVREGVDFLDIDYAAFCRRAEASGAFLGQKERHFGFDETRFNHEKMMSTLGKPFDPRYEGLKPQDKVYTPVVFEEVDVLAALRSDAPGPGIYAAHLGLGGVTPDMLYAEMQGAADTLYRYNCAITLGLLGDRRALPVLTEIVEKRDAFFFCACRRSNQFRTAVAICLLGRIGNADTAALLESLLDEAEYENPMYHTLKPDYLYYARNDRNFVYYAVITHTLVALCKTYRREGLPMAALRERVLPFLDGKFRERVSDLVPGSPTTEETELFIEAIKKMMAE